MRTLIRWWPVILAAGVGALMWGTGLEPVSRLLVVLPLVYVGVTAIGRRSWSWVVLAAATGLFLALEAAGTDPRPALWAVAAAAALAGLVAGTAGRRQTAVQAVAFAGFAAVAALATAVEPDAGRWVAAAGWLGHGLWDLAHLRRDRVVSRSYAEWCGVLDVLVAAQLLLA